MTQKSASGITHSLNRFSSSDVLTLENKSGMRLGFTRYGGKVISLLAPDRHGVWADVILGYDHVSDYYTGNPYFGAIIGRYANRIRHGKFQLDGKIFQLPVNNGVNTLHGGPSGFHQVVWDIALRNEQRVELLFESPDGDGNFPGRLVVKVTYQITDDNEWIVTYEANTDRVTVLNLTHHAFFNLKGEGQGDVLDHEIRIDADRFCEVDGELIPTGELRDVKHTPFDFRVERMIGESIAFDDEQLRLASGYDHNWVLNKKQGELSLAARVLDPASGRVMEVLTTEPGLQFYSGNFLDGTDIGKGGKAYGHRSAFCLEAQHFPDSPNQPQFPSTILRAGEVYRQKTIYRFRTQ